MKTKTEQTETLTTRLPTDLLDDLRAYAKQAERSVNQEIIFRLRLSIGKAEGDINEMRERLAAAEQAIIELQKRVK